MTIATRIALISEHASPLVESGAIDAGGQNVYVSHVARQLAARGWLVDVFCRRDDAGQPVVINWYPGLRVINVPAGPPERIPKEDLLPHMGAFMQWMREFIHHQAVSYDLIHANFFMSALVGVQLKQSLGIPLVVTFHALGGVRREHQRAADRFPDERCAIEQLVMDQADAVIAECPQDLADMRRLHDARPWRTHIVPCGFDASEFSPYAQRGARHRLGMAADEFSVLQLGRMVPRKGVDTVIESIGVLRHNFGIHASLYVVGGNARAVDTANTPELAHLRAVAYEAGVDDQVYFVGQRNRHELADFYCAADVFVTTPWYEPFGITSIEAMACARPVIGADVGGIRLTVQHERTGFLVPPRNPLAVAERLAQLHDAPMLARQMGEAGQARAAAHFTWAGVVDELIVVYSAVLADSEEAIDDEAGLRLRVPPALAPLSARP
ncbi:MAG: glycosyltransferase [Rhodocyclaceae bacterium]